MSLLSRLIDSSAGGDDDNQRPVLLQLNDESVTVSAADAAGLSVRELFTRFAESLGDTARLNNFVMNARAVTPATIVEPGATVRAAVTTDSKGN